MVLSPTPKYLVRAAGRDEKFDSPICPANPAPPAPTPVCCTPENTVNGEPLVSVVMFRICQPLVSFLFSQFSARIFSSGRFWIALNVNTCVTSNVDGPRSGRRSSGSCGGPCSIVPVLNCSPAIIALLLSIDLENV